MSERIPAMLLELTALLNRYSQENDSATPDFILASYLTDCLRAWNAAERERKRWCGLLIQESAQEVATMTDDPTARVLAEVAAELPHLSLPRTAAGVLVVLEDALPTLPDGEDRGKLLRIAALAVAAVERLDAGEAE